MVRWNSARGHAWLALSAFAFSGYSLNLAAQDVATCKGPAELEQGIKAHPSAGAYDALGAYFGQRQKISCAISAFESAVHLDLNSWEAHFNLALALLQSNQPTQARRLRVRRHRLLHSFLSPARRCCCGQTCTGSHEFQIITSRCTFRLASFATS